MHAQKLASANQSSTTCVDDAPVAFASECVLVVAPQPFYQDRGTPIALKHVLEALSDLGGRVDLLTYPLGEEVVLRGLSIYRAANPFSFRHVPIGFSLRKVLLDVGIIIELVGRLRRTPYCCIHAVEEAAFPAILLAKREKLPVIYDMQSSLPEQLSQHRIFRFSSLRWLLERLERWLILNADVVVCSSGLLDHVRSIDPQGCAMEWSFPGQEERSSPDEIEELRRLLGIGSESRVVLYSGSFEPYQGIAMLMEAASVVLQAVPNTVFVLLGAGAREGLVSSDELVRESGPIRFVRRQPRASVGKFLAMADVVVSPRMYGDNLPLKIYDYMAAGKGIVATDCAAHRAVLGDDRAMLVEPTANTMAAAIVQLLEDPAMAARLGAAAKRYGAQHFGLARFRAIVTKVYGEALVSRAARASA